VLFIPLLINLIITIASFIILKKNDNNYKPVPAYRINLFLFFSIVSAIPTIQAFTTNGDLRGGGSELAVRGAEYFFLTMIGLFFGLSACLSKGKKDGSFIRKFKIATSITYLPFVLFLLFMLFNSLSE
jgi:hypothetical protein